MFKFIIDIDCENEMSSQLKMIEKSQDKNFGNDDDEEQTKVDKDRE